jgi:hypothetical protein
LRKAHRRGAIEPKGLFLLEKAVTRHDAAKHKRPFSLKKSPLPIPPDAGRKAQGVDFI